MSDDQSVYEFEKSRATVRATVSTFRGKRYVSIREFVEPRDQPGSALIPTKAGVTVEVDDLPELRACVDALEAAVTTDAKSGRRQA